MPFLSHAFPWTSLASLFEYRPARSGPGPQTADLFPKGKPGQVKQLEHFAVKFQDVVREHSDIERKRYRSAEAYAERARGWRSVRDRDGIEGGNDVDDAQVTSTDGDGQIRGAPKKPKDDSEEIWSTPQESRRVFPQDFTQRYLPSVSITSGHAYGRKGLVDDFANIQTWIDLCTRRKSRSTATREQQNRIWLDERSCSDIIRLLIIEAATNEDVDRRTHIIETLFLLAHHPQIGIRLFNSLGMDCCNINVGIDRLPEKVVCAFLYLNILCALIDNDSSSRLAKLDEGVDYAEVSRSKMPYRRAAVFVTLLPRPVYMNTYSFYMMLNDLLDDHGHKVEHVFFTPLFAPRPNSHHLAHQQVNSDDSKPHERDVLSDIPALKAAFKSMWKMLVYSDMVLRETGRGLNWEYLVLTTLNGLWEQKRLFGDYFLNYELSRGRDFRLWE